MSVAEWKYVLSTADALKKIKALQKRPHKDLGWWFLIEDVSHELVPQALIKLADRDQIYGRPSTYRTAHAYRGRYFIDDTVILTICRDVLPPVNKKTAG